MDRRLKRFKITLLITEIINFVTAPFAFCVQLFYTYISVCMNIEANKAFNINFELFVFGITHLSIIVLVSLGIASICMTSNLVKLQINNASSGEIKKQCTTLQIMRAISLLTAITGMISILITLYRGSIDNAGFNIEYSITMLLCFSPVWSYYIVECIFTPLTFFILKKYSNSISYHR